MKPCEKIMPAVASADYAAAAECPGDCGSHGVELAANATRRDRPLAQGAEFAQLDARRSTPADTQNLVRLDPALVVPRLEARDKIGAIKELVDRLRQQQVIGDSLQFLQSVLERERLQSTILEGSVALPHARCPAVRRLGLAVGLAHPPLEYPSGDELRKIPVILLIAVPPRSPGLYLNLMARLVHRLRDPAVRSRLQAALSFTEIQELLTAKEDVAAPGRSRHQTS